MENDVLYNRIMNVVHKEYGDGSTAVANPTGEPTDALETIQIGDDVYSISSGGGVLILEGEFSSRSVDLNASYNDIKSAFLSGKNIILLYSETVEEATYYDYSNFIISEIIEYNGTYTLSGNYTIDNGITNFSTEIEDPDADVVIPLD